MEEARGEGNAIIKQHEDALRQLAKQHEEEVKRQVETRIKAEQVSAKQQLNMAMSKAQLELKREISATQFELKKELFQEVKEKLNDYMQTPQYQALLVTYIEKAAGFADGKEMTIYLNPSDARWKDYLEEHTGMKLTISKEDFIGGVRAVIHERNILVDYAFKGALENESHKFSFKGGAGID
jgi:vacuolar-type H+-ATPase subunit E/Vma4